MSNPSAFLDVRREQLLGDAVSLAIARFARHRFGFALVGYAMFGVGYIGDMTFVIALLREQGVGGGAITLFYALLGLATLASSRSWAGLLEHFRGEQAPGE